MDPNLSEASCSACNARGAECAQLKQQLDHSVQAFLVLKQKLAATDQLISKCEAKSQESEDQEKQIEELSVICDSQKLELKRVSAELAAKTKQVQPLLQAEKDRSASIYQLQKDLDSAESKIEAGDKMRLQYEEKCKELKEKCIEAEDSVKSLKKELSQQKTLVKKLKEDLKNEKAGIKKKKKIDLEAELIDKMMDTEKLRESSTQTVTPANHVIRHVTSIDIKPINDVVSEDVDLILTSMKFLSKAPLSPIKDDFLFVKPLPPGPPKKTVVKAQASPAAEEVKAQEHLNANGDSNSGIKVFPEVSTPKLAAGSTANNTAGQPKPKFQAKSSAKVPFLYRTVTPAKKRRLIFKRLGKLSGFSRTSLVARRAEIIHSGEITMKKSKVDELEMGAEDVPEQKVDLPGLEPTGVPLPVSSEILLQKVESPGIEPSNERKTIGWIGKDDDCLEDQSGVAAMEEVTVGVESSLTSVSSGLLPDGACLLSRGAHADISVSSSPPSSRLSDNIEVSGSPTAIDVPSSFCPVPFPSVYSVTPYISAPVQILHTDSFVRTSILDNSQKKLRQESHVVPEPSHPIDAGRPYVQEISSGLAKAVHSVGETGRQKISIPSAAALAPEGLLTNEHVKLSFNNARASESAKEDVTSSTQQRLLRSFADAGVVASSSYVSPMIVEEGKEDQVELTGPSSSSVVGLPFSDTSRSIQLGSVKATRSSTPSVLESDSSLVNLSSRVSNPDPTQKERHAFPSGRVSPTSFKPAVPASPFRTSSWSMPFSSQDIQPTSPPKPVTKDTSRTVSFSEVREELTFEAEERVPSGRQAVSSLSETSDTLSSLDSSAYESDSDDENTSSQQQQSPHRRPLEKVPKPLTKSTSSAVTDLASAKVESDQVSSRTESADPSPIKTTRGRNSIDTVSSPAQSGLEISTSQGRSASQLSPVNPDLTSSDNESQSSVSSRFNLSPHKVTNGQPRDTRPVLPPSSKSLLPVARDTDTKSDKSLNRRPDLRDRPAPDLTPRKQSDRWQPMAKSNIEEQGGSSLLSSPTRTMRSGKASPRTAGAATDCPSSSPRRSTLRSSTVLESSENETQSDQPFGSQRSRWSFRVSESENGIQTDRLTGRRSARSSRSSDNETSQNEIQTDRLAARRISTRSSQSSDNETATELPFENGGGKKKSLRVSESETETPTDRLTGRENGEGSTCRRSVRVSQLSEKGKQSDQLAFDDISKKPTKSLVRYSVTESSESETKSELTESDSENMESPPKKVVSEQSESDDDILISPVKTGRSRARNRLTSESESELKQPAAIQKRGRGRPPKAKARESSLAEEIRMETKPLVLPKEPNMTSIAARSSRFGTSNKTSVASSARDRVGMSDETSSSPAATDHLSVETRTSRRRPRQLEISESEPEQSDGITSPPVRGRGGTRKNAVSSDGDLDLDIQADTTGSVPSLPPRITRRAASSLDVSEVGSVTAGERSQPSPQMSTVRTRATNALNEQLKRRRSPRPSSHVDSEISESEPEQDETSLPLPLKKGRGRPRKNTLADPSSVSPSSAQNRGESSQEEPRSLRSRTLSESMSPPPTRHTKKGGIQKALPPSALHMPGSQISLGSITFDLPSFTPEPITTSSRQTERLNKHDARSPPRPVAVVAAWSVATDPSNEEEPSLGPSVLGAKSPSGMLFDSQLVKLVSLPHHRLKSVPKEPLVSGTVGEPATLPFVRVGDDRLAAPVPHPGSTENAAFNISLSNNGCLKQDTELTMPWTTAWSFSAKPSPASTPKHASISALLGPPAKPFFEDRSSRNQVEYLDDVCTPSVPEVLDPNIQHIEKSLKGHETTAEGPPRQAPRFGARLQPAGPKGGASKRGFPFEDLDNPNVRNKQAKKGTGIVDFAAELQKFVKTKSKVQEEEMKCKVEEVKMDGKTEIQKDATESEMEERGCIKEQVKQREDAEKVDSGTGRKNEMDEKHLIKDSEADYDSSSSCDALTIDADDEDLRSPIRRPKPKAEKIVSPQQQRPVSPVEAGTVAPTASAEALLDRTISSFKFYTMPSQAELPPPQLVDEPKTTWTPTLSNPLPKTGPTSLLDLDLGFQPTETTPVPRLAEERLTPRAGESIIATLRTSYVHQLRARKFYRKTSLNVRGLLGPLRTTGWNASANLAGLVEKLLKDMVVQHPDALPRNIISLLLLDTASPVIEAELPQPSLTLFQQRLIIVILALEAATRSKRLRASHPYHSLPETILTAVHYTIFEIHTIPQKEEFAHLIRFYTGLAKAKQMLDRVRCLIMDVVYHYPPLSSHFVYTIATVWPEAVRGANHSQTPSVYEQLLVYLMSSNSKVAHQGTHGKLLGLFQKTYKIMGLKHGSYPTPQLLCDYYIEVLSKSASSDELYLVCMCLATLCRWEGLEFAWSEILEKRLWPVFLQWREGKLHQKGGAYAILAVGMVARLLHNSHADRVDAVCEILSNLVCSDSVSDVIRDSAMESMVMIDINRKSGKAYQLLEKWKSWSINKRLAVDLASYIVSWERNTSAKNRF